MQQPNQVNSGAPASTATTTVIPQTVPNTSPASTGATGTATTTKTLVNGGRFDFDDGGTYCGGWEDGKAHGHGVCTGPKGQGAYSGSWNYGFEVSGVYTWPSGSSYEGQWQNGKRHGLGVESRGRWFYRGEWTQGFKGRYGVRQSSSSNAKFEGTWANGLQDGYGSETYADGGTYQGQWQRGMRYGYGVRTSAPFGLASHYRPKAIRASMTSLRSNDGAAGQGTIDPAAERDRRVDDSRGGFVLKAKSDEPLRRSAADKKSIFSGLKLKKRGSTGDLDKKGTYASIRSTGSNASWMSTESSQSGLTNASIHTDSNASFVVEDEQMDANVTETYMGEWKNDKRTGCGISERSDGLKYEGEWVANKKHGYGVTTFRDGSKEEGKYKNNILITSEKKKHLFIMRSSKFRERIDAAVNAAQRASKFALQKADIAISRTATARSKAEQADEASDHARVDSDIARRIAKQFAPDFEQPGLDRIRRETPRFRPNLDGVPGASILSNPSTTRNTNEAVNAVSNTQQYQQNQQPQIQQNQHQFQHNQQSQYQHNQQSQYQHNQQPQYQHNQTSQYQHNQQQQYQQSQVNAHFEQPVQNTTNSPSMLITDIDSNKPYMNKIGPGDQITSPNRVPNAIPPSLQSQVQNVSYEDSRNNPPTVNSLSGPNNTLRRNSKLVQASESPAYSYQQAMNDRFDHYKRPPSRDSSVDRYSKAASRLGGLGSRQSSVDKTTPRDPSVDRMTRAPSAARGTTPVPAGITGNGSIVGPGASGNQTPVYSVPNSVIGQPPFEEILMRKRTLGQDIIPSPGQPKRTESLYINPGIKREIIPKSIPIPSGLQRKKSLPDVQGSISLDPMSREEASVLSSARREEVRRMAEEADRLRANPLLYLVSPHVKDWFSRQQLVMLVLFINISLAIMFFKLLT